MSSSRLRNIKNAEEWKNISPSRKSWIRYWKNLYKAEGIEDGEAITDEEDGRVTTLTGLPNQEPGLLEFLALSKPTSKPLTISSALANIGAEATNSSIEVPTPQSSNTNSHKISPISWPSKFARSVEGIWSGTTIKEVNGMEKYVGLMQGIKMSLLERLWAKTCVCSLLSTNRKSSLVTLIPKMFTQGSDFHSLLFMFFASSPAVTLLRSLLQAGTKNIAIQAKGLSYLWWGSMRIGESVLGCGVPFLSHATAYGTLWSWVD